MRQFGRFVRVVVGTGSDVGLDVSEMRVSFKITRKLSAHAGACELEIFNLSPEHTQQVVGAPRRQTYVAVDAGYNSSVGRNISRLFTGDIHKAVPSWSGATSSLKITAGDGAHALRGARVSRSFAAGVTLTSVVQHIAEAMEVGIGNAVEALRGASFSDGAAMFEDGAVLYGRAADELSRLTDAAALEWSIQDNQLILLPMGGAIQRTAIRIAADSGMVGSPVIVNRRTVTVKALIQPGLTPGQRVVIDSRLVRGEYRIHESVFTGSNFDQDFAAELTCQLPRDPLLGRR